VTTLLNAWRGHPERLVDAEYPNFDASIGLDAYLLCPARLTGLRAYYVTSR
jgi:hypothetical protein